MGMTLNWIRILGRLPRYTAYRLGLARPVTYMDRREEAKNAICQVLGWRKRLRVVHPERCPRSGPAVFAGNHCFAEDPFIMYYAISEASDRNVNPRFMMREGVFSSSRLLKNRLFDVDEFATLFGALLISRENIQLSQLKPFVKLLREGESFIIYPTRTRTRTGAIVEFPKGFDEPGGVSFFLIHSQRNRPEIRPVAVPVTRTDNLVTGMVTLVFGDPQFLPPDAGRDQQRDFDLRLVKLIADNVQVNVPQLLSVVLYLRCLHGLPQQVELDELVHTVEAALAHIGTRQLLEPDVRSVPQQVSATLQWLAKQGMLTLTGDRADLNPAAILASPPPDREYRRRNPVKYLTNQLLHLPHVLSAVEEAALPPAPPKGPAGRSN